MTASAGALAGRKQPLRAFVHDSPGPRTPRVDTGTIEPVRPLRRSIRRVLDAEDVDYQESTTQGTNRSQGTGAMGPPPSIGPAVPLPRNESSVATRRQPGKVSQAPRSSLSGSSSVAVRTTEQVPRSITAVGPVPAGTAMRASAAAEDHLANSPGKLYRVSAKPARTRDSMSEQQQEQLGLGMGSTGSDESPSVAERHYAARIADVPLLPASSCELLLHPPKRSAPTDRRLPSFGADGTRRMDPLTALPASAPSSMLRRHQLAHVLLDLVSRVFAFDFGQPGSVPRLPSESLHEEYFLYVHNNVFSLPEPDLFGMESMAHQMHQELSMQFNDLLTFDGMSSVASDCLQQWVVDSRQQPEDALLQVQMQHNGGEQAREEVAAGHGTVSMLSAPPSVAGTAALGARASRDTGQGRLCNLSTLSNIVGPLFIQPATASLLVPPASRRSMGRSLVSDEDLKRAIEEFKRGRRRGSAMAANAERGTAESDEEAAGSFSAANVAGEDEEDESGNFMGETPVSGLLVAAAPPSVVDLKVGKDSKTRLTTHSAALLTNWLEMHVLDPYPDAVEKQKLCQQTGLNEKQITNWLVNNRKRKWAPLFKHLLEKKLIESTDESSEKLVKELFVDQLDNFSLAEIRKGLAGGAAGSKHRGENMFIMEERAAAASAGTGAGPAVSPHRNADQMRGQNPASGDGDGSSGSHHRTSHC